MNSLVQLEILKALKNLGKDAFDDPGDSQDLDGMRIMRTMGRMRSLKNQLSSNPGRIIREYEEMWAKELGAGHKPWTWRDVAAHVSWGRCRSMLRVFVMLGEIKALMEQGEALQAEAQLVQCMKAIHSFGLHGNWKLAWGYTHLQDPCAKPTHAGTEVEMEAIVGLLRTQEDLRKKTLSTRQLAGADDEHQEAPDETPGDGKKGRKK